MTIFSFPEHLDAGFDVLLIMVHWWMKISCPQSGSRNMWQEQTDKNRLKLFLSFRRKELEKKEEEDFASVSVVDDDRDKNV